MSTFEEEFMKRRRKYFYFARTSRDPDELHRIARMDDNYLRSLVVENQNAYLCDRVQIVQENNNPIIQKAGNDSRMLDDPSSMTISEFIETDVLWKSMQTPSQTVGSPEVDERLLDEIGENRFKEFMKCNAVLEHEKTAIEKSRGSHKIDVDLETTEKPLDIENGGIGEPQKEDIILGDDLDGSKEYSRDLEVAQMTGRDIDEADIPNDTPDEIREKEKGSIRQRMNDAKEKAGGQSKSNRQNSVLRDDRTR